ncbi:FKBP-type peptidyl-prolyl cis-trans isomerase [bacterium]|nr:FKBP-type peptidyl-prolyl cis-trans isomerase [bacterium]
MKLLTTIATCGMFLLILNCKTGFNRGSSELATYEDSLSYLIGTDIARMQLMNLKDELDLDLLMKGLKDQLDAKPLLLTIEDREAIIQKYETRSMEEETDVAALNLEDGKLFLEEYKMRKDVVITKSGLHYIVLEEGNGPKPKINDRVLVHYRGSTIDGNEFDSSYKYGEPQTLAVNGVIKGFSEALQLMNVGSKYEIVMPSELAYGKEGQPPDIGPNAVLVFRIDLLGIAN